MSASPVSAESAASVVVGQVVAPPLQCPSQCDHHDFREPVSVSESSVMRPSSAIPVTPIHDVSKPQQCLSHENRTTRSISRTDGITVDATDSPCRLQRVLTTGSLSQEQRDQLRLLVGDVGLTLFAPLDGILDERRESRQDLVSSKLDKNRRNRSCRQVPSASPAGLVRDFRDSNRHEMGIETTTKFEHFNVPITSIPDKTLPEELDPVDTTLSCSTSSSLSWEPWQDLVSCPRILTDRGFQQIRSALPDTLRMNQWERCFAIGRDGDSMISLLNLCSQYSYTILVIQTTQNEILGGFATECWNVGKGTRPKSSYYGTGQSFLFCSDPDVIPGTDDERNEDDEFAIYSWTGMNDYCQICSPEQNRLAMGGEGDFGLVVQDNFSIGQTGRSMTFRNPPLVSTGGRFEIAALEVYGLVSLFASLSPTSTPYSSKDEMPVSPSGSEC